MVNVIEVISSIQVVQEQLTIVTTCVDSGEGPS